MKNYNVFELGKCICIEIWKSTVFEFDLAYLYLYQNAYFDMCDTLV